MSRFPDMDLFRRHVAEGYPLPAPQEDDVNLTDPMKNGFGDTVQFQQVVAGTELRVADAQARLGNVENKINALTTAVAKLTTPVPGAVTELDAPVAALDYDLLAQKVADLLAARLGS